MYGELIKFDNVSFGYSDNLILKNLNFSLLKGEFYFLTGASGAGKTSLLKLLSLDCAPNFGDIFIFQKNVKNIDFVNFRSKVGIILQKPFLMNHLNILENTMLPLKIAGIDPVSKMQDVIELLGWVGLKNCLHKYPNEISIGEQHRVSIARAVVMNPELILADEPTGNVDQETSNKINNLFLALNKLGSTIIFATHKIKDIKTLGLPSLHIKDGYIKKIIPTGKL